MPRKWLAHTFDLLILVCLGIWVSGGVVWNSHLYLKHGADPRRAAVLLGIAGYVFFPSLREESRVLVWALRFGRRLSEKRFRWGCYLALTFIASALAMMQTLALRVTLYDVGIFHQILWSLSSGEGFHSTISKAGNFLQDHFSPTLALLVPLFKFCLGTPFFLPVAQVFLILGGAAAWIYLAEKISGERGHSTSDLPAATAVFILGFESLWGNLRWGFHENALAFLGLSWAFALLFTVNFRVDSVDSWYRRLGALCLLSIAAFSKEIILVDVSFAMVVWVVIELMKNHGLRSTEPGWRRFSQFFTFILALLALGFVWQFIRFESMEHPADKNYFDRYYSYLGHDVSSFFANLFRFPQLILSNIGPRVLTDYMMTVFLPWLFLPFAFVMARVRKAGYDGSFFLWLGVILPSFGSAALSTYSPLRSSQLHYVLELWPVLASLSLVALGAIGKRSWIWAWALFSILRWDYDPISDFREYWVQIGHQQGIRAVLEQIPESASVMADDLAGPWVSGRKWVARWPDAALLPGGCADYWVIQGNRSDSQEGRNRILHLFPDCFRQNAEISVGQLGIENIYQSSSWAVFRRTNVH